MRCSKIKYETATKAWRAIKKINKKNKSQKLKGVYICEKCNWFHLTSSNDKRQKYFEVEAVKNLD